MIKCYKHKYSKDTYVSTVCKDFHLYEEFDFDDYNNRSPYYMDGRLTVPFGWEIIHDRMLNVVSHSELIPGYRGMGWDIKYRIKKIVLDFELVVRHHYDNDTYDVVSHCHLEDNTTKYLSEFPKFEYLTLIKQDSDTDSLHEYVYYSDLHLLYFGRSYNEY